MLIIKIFIYTFIFLTTSAIGMLKSKKYIDRVDELKEMKAAISVFKTKLKYTYEPIPEIFNEISESFNSVIGKIFKIASLNMQNINAGTAWNMAIDLGTLNINSEDKSILKNLGKLLGETDLNGQISQIELTENFLEEQIKKAERERQKNEKLYRTLGMTGGLAIVIILL